MSKQTPDQLVRYFGTQSAAAKELCYTRAAVSLWVKNKKLPLRVQHHFAAHKAAQAKAGKK